MAWIWLFSSTDKATTSQADWWSRKAAQHHATGPSALLTRRQISGQSMLANGVARTTSRFCTLGGSSISAWPVRYFSGWTFARYGISLLASGKHGRWGDVDMAVSVGDGGRRGRADKAETGCLWTPSYSELDTAAITVSGLGREKPLSP